LRSPRDTTLDSAGGIASDASTGCCVGAPQCEAPEGVDIVPAYLNGEMFNIYDRWDRRSDSLWWDEGAEISKGLEISSYPQMRRSVPKPNRKLSFAQVSDKNTKAEMRLIS